MRRWLACLVLAGACTSGTTQDQELCAKAAAMFDRCEQLDTGSGSDAAISRELTIDRWRGLCRAVFTGKTEQLMPAARDLFLQMDEATRAGLRVQAECTAKATSCAAYAQCSE